MFPGISCGAVLEKLTCARDPACEWRFSQEWLILTGVALLLATGAAGFQKESLLWV